MINRISGRVAVAAGAAAAVAGTAFLVAAYTVPAVDAGQAATAVQAPPDAPDDFFAAADPVGDTDLRQRRERAQERIEAAGGLALTTGTGTVEQAREEPREPESADDGDAGGGAADSAGPVDPNLGGDVDGLNWAALARCESGGDPAAVNPAGYYGLYQFTMPTWRSVGGSGSPAEAGADEQTMRAKLLYNRANGDWQSQWPSCGHHLFG
ncbi:hypothetical protein HNR23_003513 [Nocardiopsis mwathae]|uniref:Resuscitation-promoting factor core lysozyme-like domain-containing protein n=1 Tax=Nocardiopsis mwathae TaxID=1472723 RepID=A0A7W9YJS1_9ACTN|nr:hypothetical protein [Nocardiopsis mwathae]